MKENLLCPFFGLENRTKQCGFSLVEMLMALLVASLLLAALAPVMTKRFSSDKLDISGNFEVKDRNVKTYEINYNSSGNGELVYDCTEIKTDTDGSQYCEGEIIIPSGYNGQMMVTLISAGGGGGTAPTAGYTEYTTAGSTNTFTVPAMVNKLEATLVSGGAGGGGGGQVTKTQTFVTTGTGGITADSNNIVTVNADGTGTWTIPEIARSKDILAQAVGGGGGGGTGTGNWWAPTTNNYGYGGGSGGYVSKILNFAGASSLTYYVGGGGAGGNNPYGPGLVESMLAKAAGGGGGGYYSNGNGNGASCPISYSPTSPLSPGGPAASSLSGKGGQGYLLAGYGYPSGSAGGTQGGGAGSVIHYNSCASGGGGGGGGASQILIGTGTYLDAPGGGGGSSHQRVAGGNNCSAGTVAGGGGGGGAGGGNGGGSNDNTGKGGSGGSNASGASGGTKATVFGGTYGFGGNGGSLYLDAAGNIVQTHSTAGQSGAIRLTYLDYGPGGSGGGAGSIIPKQPVTVTPNENLTVNIGTGAPGATTYEINSSGSVVLATNPAAANWYIKNETNLLRGSTYIFRTHSGVGYVSQSGCNGNVTPSVYCGMPGYIHDGGIGTTGFKAVTVDGFANSRGYAPGNSVLADAPSSYTEITGGAGGTVTTPWFTCTPGKGGTAANPTGGDATGYGCGGGGGYGLSNGGSGSGGYARISWNLFWDTAAEAYKRAEIGSGGGGASGAIMKFSVNAIGGQPMNIRIGKGGDGAKIVSNSEIAAKKGGDTVFGTSATGEVRALGGNPGKSPTASATAFTNGEGGSKPGTKICTFSGTDYTSRSAYCTKGAKGTTPTGSEGGSGGNLAGYGTGGAGGMQDTGDNANGKPGQSIGSGGGGAAIREITGSVPAGNILNNPNAGGDGANGKIIIQIFEL